MDNDMVINIEFLKPFTGTLVWDCVNTLLGEDLRFAKPQRTPQEIVEETNKWLNTANETLPAAIDEIESALDGKDEAQKERYVFSLVKGFYKIAFIYGDWKLQEARENGDESRIRKQEQRHKRIWEALRNGEQEGIDCVEKALCSFYGWAVDFGILLSTLLKSCDVSIDGIRNRYPLNFGQEIDMKVCADFLCLYLSQPPQDSDKLQETDKKEDKKQNTCSETVQQGLLFYFRNDEELLRSFTDKCRKGDFKPRVIGSMYKQLGAKVLQRGNPNFVAKTLHGLLQQIGLVKIKYGTFKDYV